MVVMQEARLMFGCQDEQPHGTGWSGSAREGFDETFQLGLEIDGCKVVTLDV